MQVGAQGLPLDDGLIIRACRSRIAVKALVEADAARDVTDKNGDKPTHLAAKRLVYEPKRYASTIGERNPSPRSMLLRAQASRSAACAAILTLPNTA